jgi:hypothetical protein
MTTQDADLDAIRQLVATAEHAQNTGAPAGEVASTSRPIFDPS